MLEVPSNRRLSLISTSSSHLLLSNDVALLFSDSPTEVPNSHLLSSFLNSRVHVPLICSFARSVNGQDLTRESFSGPVAPVTRQLANNGKMDGPDLEIIQTEASTQ